MNRKNRHHTPTLVIFGEDFERFGGIRAFAIADGMNEEDPIDCVDYNLDNLTSRLGDLAAEGYEDVEDLEPLVAACIELRDQYGHEVWIANALLDYLRCVRGIVEPSATSLRDQMLASARDRFAPISSAYELRQRHASLEWCAGQLGLLVDDMRGTVARLQQLLNASASASQFD